MSSERVIADALGRILGKGFRARLYRELTEGLGEGLNESTYPVFSAVARSGAAVSAQDLAREVGTDRSVVSRRASTLLAAGLVASVPGSDSRALYLVLSERGEQVAAVLRERLDGAIAHHVKDWTDDDVARFARLLSAFGERPL